MDVFVYSDESGVFDVVHNDVFVFGGLIFLGKESKDDCSRLYSHAEKVLRDNKGVNRDYELKATRLENSEKSQLFRSLNGFYKFGVVIKQKYLHERIFDNKKTKQRYLDYAYKIALKRALKSLIVSEVLNENEVENIHIYVDEHTTATDGIYELRESIEQEFKFGIFNYNYGVFHEPLFTSVNTVQLQFCDSSTVRLVRAADIVANKLFYLAVNDKLYKQKRDHFFITFLP